MSREKISCLDRAGVFVSFVCAMHCVVLFLARLPFAGIAFCKAAGACDHRQSRVIAGWSLTRAYRLDRNPVSLTVVILGFALLSIGRLPNASPAWIWLTAGGLTIAAVHLLNWRMHSSCHNWTISRHLVSLNMEKDFSGLLQQHHLHITAPRLSVLKMIASRDSATSQPFLEKNITEDIDRVTLYRILKTFEEKGILHKVMDTNGTANYAMCSEACSAGHHHDEHVHFNCTKCEQLYCLTDYHLPPLNLPDGYTAEDINMLISGVCVHCKGSL